MRSSLLPLLLLLTCSLLVGTFWVPEQVREQADTPLDVRLDSDSEAADRAHACGTAAREGRTQAQNRLGVMYEYGHGGLLQDYAAAVAWYRLAADQGFAEAQRNLGRMYYHGKGVSRNYVQAHMWYNLANVKSRGYDFETVGLLSVVEEAMTSRQVARAQRLAREWKPKIWEEVKGRLK